VYAYVYVCVCVCMPFHRPQVHALDGCCCGPKGEVLFLHDEGKMMDRRDILFFQFWHQRRTSAKIFDLAKKKSSKPLRFDWRRNLAGGNLNRVKFRGVVV
jgi:hypothetical protein